MITWPGLRPRPAHQMSDGRAILEEGIAAGAMPDAVMLGPWGGYHVLAQNPPEEKQIGQFRDRIFSEQMVKAPG